MSEVERTKLIKMRRARMLTQEAVAELIRRDRVTISRWERREQTPGINACRALAEVYDVSFEELWAAVDGDGERSRPSFRDGWWSNYETYEQSARVIRTWESMVIPGLLQTEAYACALLEDDDLVARRLARQSIVTREDDPAKLLAIIDESALHRPVGGAEVLAGQLRHLLTVAERANVALHVLPLDAAATAVADGSRGAFVVLEPSWPGGLVHLEHTGGARSLEHEYEIEAHLDTFEQLRSAALSREDSLERIRRRIEEMQHE